MLWGSRKGAGSPAGVAADAGTVPTKALAKFLRCFSGHPAPVLLDLGPVVGANITFLGERLGCKIIVQDLFADLDRFPVSRNLPLAGSLGARVTHAPASVDGILCWNVFDFLDAPSARTLASGLTRILRPDGAALGFFANCSAAHVPLSKYVIVDDHTLKPRPYSRGGGQQLALHNRDIIRMFDGLNVSESFLLKTSFREFLFRKPASPAMSDNDSTAAPWEDQLSGY
jgi:hypothetical protein